MDVTNLSKALSTKPLESTSSFESLILSKTVQELKLGTVTTVNSNTDLLSLEKPIGSLAFVENENNLYYANQFNNTKFWTPFLQATAQIYSWGRNNEGQLGLGQTVNRSSPTPLSGYGNWIDISKGTGGGLHTAAIRYDGTLWTWGRNNTGQLGDGSTINRSIPVQIASEIKWKKVTVGDFSTIAQSEDGRLWSWGSNSQATLGRPGGDTSIPELVNSNISDWTKIVLGGYSAAALRSDESLYVWGYNVLGQLGLGDPSNRQSPTPNSALQGWKDIAVGQNMMIGIASTSTNKSYSVAFDGRGGIAVQNNSVLNLNINQFTIDFWIYLNSTIITNTTVFQKDGQINTGAAAVQYELQLLSGNNLRFTIGNVNINISNFLTNQQWTHVAIVRNANNVKIFRNGTLIQESNTAITVTTAARELTLGGIPDSAQITSGGKFARTFTGYLTNFRIIRNRSLYSNNFTVPLVPLSGIFDTVLLTCKDQILRDSSQYNLPIFNGGGAIVSTFAPEITATLWTWGNNTEGQLGDGNTVTRSSPVPVFTTLTNWVSVSASSFNAAGILSNGTLQTWGGNTQGQLGNNNTIGVSSPTDVVGGITNWVQIQQGEFHAVALRSSGQLYAWGYNLPGSLGDGTTNARSSPVLVIGSSTWYTYNVNGYSTYAIARK